MPQFVYSYLFTLNLVSIDVHVLSVIFYACMYENKLTYFHDK